MTTKPIPTKPTTRPTKRRTRAQGASGTRPPANARTATTAHDKRGKFGLRKGTKVSMAAAMFEKGCTMADVKKATGSNQYNVLRSLETAGHAITRDGKAIKLALKAG